MQWIYLLDGIMRRGFGFDAEPCGQPNLAVSLDSRDICEIVDMI